MSQSAVKLVGLIRDFLMAAFGVYILFGGHISESQELGIIAVVAPAVALGSYIYSNVSSPRGQL
jgi:hypothetical protein